MADELIEDLKVPEILSEALQGFLEATRGVTDARAWDDWALADELGKTSNALIFGCLLLRTHAQTT